ncbi:MAG: hypothetical protein M0R33_11525 [Methylomonas sp.]|uniref:hypothetical protein n=1 Tax=Methylomonas sp. TaxID=418 RepID=UPI0025D138A8|nr:hypothetical protein [Methylomonas sp.]MCK9607064.1 hypothetical protein [Methylomonas sp.]
MAIGSLDVGLCSENSVDFRVSGIMQLGSGVFRALLEFPDGEKKTVAPGDDLQAWKVIAITENCITLSANNKSRNECIAGSSDSNPMAKTSTDEKSPKAPPSAPDNSLSHFKKVDKIELLQALDSLAHADNMSQFNETVLPLAGLPPDAQIAQIDARDISSVHNAVEMLRKAVDENHPSRLTLINQDQQVNVIYLQTTE